MPCNCRPISVDLVDVALLSPVAVCPSSLDSSRLGAGNSIPSSVFKHDYGFCVLSECLIMVEQGGSQVYISGF